MEVNKSIFRQITYNDVFWFYAYPVILSLVLTTLLIPALIGLDTFLLLVHLDELIPTTWFYNALILITAIFVFGLLLEAIYFLGHFLAIMGSYLKRIFQALIPGLVVFILIGWPVIHLLDGYQDNLLVIAAMAGVALSACVLVILLFFYWPDFQGSNPSFLLVSGMCSLIVYYWIPLNPASPWFTLIFKWFGIVILTALFYINLHIRNKFELQLRLEQHLLSARTIYFVTGFLFVLLAGFISVSIFKPLDFESLEIIHITVLVAILLTLRWLLFISASHYNHLWKFQTILSHSRKGIGSLALICLICLASFYNILNIKTPIQSHIAAANNGALAFMTLSGLLLDLDNDNNSYWPGHDPDDEDPCIHFGNGNSCDTQTSLPATHISSYSINSHKFFKMPEAGAYRDVFLLTIILDTKSEIPATLASLAGQHSWVSRSLLMPALDTQIGLRNLFSGQNGLDIYAHKTRKSLISDFNDFGYRSLCFEMSPTSHKPTGVLEGCQIVNQFTVMEELHHKMSTKFASYKESRNFVHLHLMASDLEKVGFGKLIQKILTINPDPVIVLLSPGQFYAKLIANSQYLYPDKEFQSIHNTIILASGGRIANPIQIDQGIFYIPKKSIFDHDLSQQYFPRRHYYQSQNKLYIFDGITGANQLIPIKSLENYE